MFEGAYPTTTRDQQTLVESIVKRVINEIAAPATTGVDHGIDDSYRTEASLRSSTKTSENKKSKKKSKKNKNKSKVTKKNSDTSSAPEQSQKKEKKKKKTRCRTKTTEEAMDAIGSILLTLQKSKLMYDSEAEEVDESEQPQLPPFVSFSKNIDRESRTDGYRMKSHQNPYQSSSLLSESSSRGSDTLFSLCGSKNNSRHNLGVGSPAFYNDVASKLSVHRNTICIRDDKNNNGDTAIAAATTATTSTITTAAMTATTSRVGPDGGDFEAAYRPEEMRCLALVSHNEMKAPMKEFVECHKHILKKFRLTGTASTMAMLSEVFRDEPDLVFGPTCSSGPLGGDAELVAHMASGQLGGIFFFQDPMTAHPHQADIKCLNRQAMVHNTVIATTPTTAMTVVKVFEMALREGRAELLPSFFFSLQSPSVAAYKTAQTRTIERLSSTSSTVPTTVRTSLSENNLSALSSSELFEFAKMDDSSISGSAHHHYHRHRHSS